MNIDDLTVTFVEDGAVKVQELAKAVLSSSSSWATIAFLFRESDGAGGWRAPKVSVRRYRKRGKGFVVDKHLTLSTSKQALGLSQAIEAWFAPGGPGDAAGAPDDED